MFSIRVVIVMLSLVVAWMYAVIKRVFTNHNMRFIISMNISLRVKYYFRLWEPRTFEPGILLATYKRVLFSSPRHQINYNLDISRSLFLEITFEINHKEYATPVRNCVSFGGLNYFLSYFCPCYFQYTQYRVYSNTVLPSMSYLYWILTLISLFFKLEIIENPLYDKGKWWRNIFFSDHSRFFMNIKVFEDIYISNYYGLYGLNNMCRTITMKTQDYFQICCVTRQESIHAVE